MKSVVGQVHKLNFIKDDTKKGIKKYYEKKIKKSKNTINKLQKKLKNANDRAFFEGLISISIGICHPGLGVAVTVVFISLESGGYKLTTGYLGPFNSNKN